MAARTPAVVLLRGLLLLAILFGSGGYGALAQQAVYHQVQWGETLADIAWLYGLTAQDIATANRLPDPSAIYPGQSLLIPGAEAPSSQSIEHVVQPGETLLGIASRYGLTVQEVARINGIGNAYLILAGQRLRVPLSPKYDQAALSQSQETLVIGRPAMSEGVSSPLTVEGWGSDIENTLVVRISTASGSLIAEKEVAVEAEIGQVGPFSAIISFKPPVTTQVAHLELSRKNVGDGDGEASATVNVNLVP